MIPLQERFIVDENGQRVGVLLAIEDVTVQVVQLMRRWVGLLRL